MKPNILNNSIDNKWHWDTKPVEEVRRNKEKHRDSEDLEGLQEVLENVILKASHFPLEFIQNAEDEESTKIGFILHKKALVIYNNGKPFRIEKDRNDIKGFCSIGVSQKHKKGIGFLGVGSKTVYKITKEPWLVSGKYNFSIEDMLYPSSQSTLPPHASNVISKIDQFPDKGAIFFSPLLPDDKGKINADEISDILNEIDKSVIMFLSSIDTIELEDRRDDIEILRLRRDNIEYYVEGDNNAPGAFVCKRIRISALKDDANDDPDATDWIVGSLNLRLSEDAKRNLPDSRLYEKKRGSESTRISIAIHLDSDEESSYPLYCFLPMREFDTGLSYILQGDFIPTADRSNIQTDLLWNKEILQGLGVLLAKIIETCQSHEEISINFYDMVPWDKNPNSNLEPFITSFRNKMLNEKFSFGNNPEAIPLRNYTICEPATSFLTNENLSKIELGDYYRLFLKKDSPLRKSLEWIGVKELTADDIFRIIVKYAGREHSDPEWLFHCTHCLATAENLGEIGEETLELMRTKEWLLTNKRKFAKPHEKLYFRMPKAKTEIEHIDDFAEVEFLHPIFTKFSGSRKYNVDKNERDTIRDFLKDRFDVKVLEDEGYLISNLVIPLLETDELPLGKRIQYFSALLFYREKLQKKLMKASGYLGDIERGKERLKEKCKNILVPAITYNIQTKKHRSVALQSIEKLYSRGRKKYPTSAFKIFNNTPDAFFVSQSFYDKVKRKINWSDKELINALEDVGISSDLKILKKEYKSRDQTPFEVRSYLTNWKLIDYEIPGLDKLDLQTLKDSPEILYLILRNLSNEYKKTDSGKDLLEAKFSSSRSWDNYRSSIARVLDEIKLKDRIGNEYSLQASVFGSKFSALIPGHPRLLPFRTDGMAKLLKDLEIREEPSGEELLSEIEKMKERYNKRADVPPSVLHRLCGIYEELLNHESSKPDIYFKSNNFDTCWFSPPECYWSDPTTQIKKNSPVIGEFYTKLGKDFTLFQGLGVSKKPTVSDIFTRLSSLREKINKSIQTPTNNDITEIRRYYRYLVGNDIPENMMSRKIFLTDSGTLVDSKSIYTSRNIELHRILSRKLPGMILNTVILPEFPGELEDKFNIKNLETTIEMNSIPSGTKNDDLTLLFRLLLSMVATYEYNNKDPHTDDRIMKLQDLSDSIEVYDTEKIEVKLDVNGNAVTLQLDTLFLNSALYLVDIRDEDRLLPRIKNYVINTLFRGVSNDTINFANQLMSDGLTIDAIQKSFFKQGFSESHISQYLDEITILKQIESADETDETQPPPAPTETEQTRKTKSAASAWNPEPIIPKLVSPFDFEVTSLRPSKSGDFHGKEIGFRKRKGSGKGSSGSGTQTKHVSNLSTEEAGLEFVKMVCMELFNVGIENVKDVHNAHEAYDIIVSFPDGKKYIEIKASLSDPTPQLSRDQFDKARKEKDDYYLFLVGNLASDFYVKYRQNPASHNHVRLGGARLKEINWDDWGKVDFSKKKKARPKTR